MTISCRVRAEGGDCPQLVDGTIQAVIGGGVGAVGAGSCPGHHAPGPHRQAQLGGGHHDRGPPRPHVSLSCVTAAFHNVCALMLEDPLLVPGVVVTAQLGHRLHLLMESACSKSFLLNETSFGLEHVLFLMS